MAREDLELLTAGIPRAAGEDLSRSVAWTWRGRGVRPGGTKKTCLRMGWGGSYLVGGEEEVPSRTCCSGISTTGGNKSNSWRFQFGIRGSVTDGI